MVLEAFHSVFSVALTFLFKIQLKDKSIRKNCLFF